MYQQFFSIILFYWKTNWKLNNYVTKIIIYIIWLNHNFIQYFAIRYCPTMWWESYNLNNKGHFFPAGSSVVWIKRSKILYRSGVFVEHRCCGAASLGSSPQCWHKSRLHNKKFKARLTHISWELFYPSMAYVAFVTMIFPWTTYQLAFRELWYVICGGL